MVQILVHDYTNLLQQIMYTTAASTSWKLSGFILFFTQQAKPRGLAGAADAQAVEWFVSRNMQVGDRLGWTLIWALDRVKKKKKCSV